MGRRHASVRRIIAILSMSAIAIVGFGTTVASAARWNSGFSPTIYGSLADLNGDGVADSADDANAFYGDTSIIDGGLDCDGWGATQNDGSAGNGTIDGGDDCTLVGYDGSVDGVLISVIDGAFVNADGAPIADGTPLPTVFNAGDPDNADVGDSDFAWSAIGGLVDSNGDEAIDGDDCHFDLVGDIDILGNPGANECGFASAPDPAHNGFVDLNGDADITTADTCLDDCFFGLDVLRGKVIDTDCTVLGTPSNDVLRGTAGPDVICGRGGIDTLIGRGGADVLRGGPGDDTMKGNRGNDRLVGGGGPDLARGGVGIDRCISAAIERSCEL